MIFLDARILRWLVESATELLAELEPVLDGIPQTAPVPCEEIVLRGVDDRFDKGGACE